LRIGLFGGTGGLGGGLAMRLSRHHEVVIGSRDAVRAESVAKELAKRVSFQYGEAVAGRLSGSSNEAVVDGCDPVVIAVPAATLEEFLGLAKRFRWRGQTVISPVTRFEREGGAFVYRPFQSSGKAVSAAELAQATLGPAAKVVAGLHSVPAARLADLKDPLGFDVPLAGEKAGALAVAEILSGVEGLRPLYAGPLSVSSSLEALTPLLLNISMRNKIKEPGFRVVE
jgi:NADPH-dependent F420 reductase